MSSHLLVPLNLLVCFHTSAFLYYQKSMRQSSRREAIGRRRGLKIPRWNAVGSNPTASSGFRVPPEPWFRIQVSRQPSAPKVVPVRFRPRALLADGARTNANRNHEPGLDEGGNTVLPLSNTGNALRIF